MTAEFPTYKVFATNVEDDFQVTMFEGQDAVTVNGATGPTLIDTGDEDDEIDVTAQTRGPPTPPHIEPIPRDFTPDTVTIEAGTGVNTLRVYESNSEISDNIHVYQDRIASNLVPDLSYRATGGAFNKIEVAGGPFSDNLYVHSTRADVAQTIVTGFFDPAFPGGATPDKILVANSNDDLSEIRNSLQIAGQSNPTTVHVRDRGAAAGNTAVNVVGDQITGFAGASDEAVIETVNGTLEVHLYGSDESTVAESFFWTRRRILR